MNRRDVAQLAFRLLGAYFFVFGVAELPALVLWPLYTSLMPGPVAGRTGLLMASAIFPLIVRLVAGWLLWAYAPNLANAIFPQSEETAAAESKICNWFLAGLVAIGFYMLASGAAVMISALAFSMAYSGTSTPGGPIGAVADTFRGGGRALISSVSDLVIGLVLVLMSEQIVAALFRRPEAIVDGE